MIPKFKEFSRHQGVCDFVNSIQKSNLIQIVFTTDPQYPFTVFYYGLPGVEEPNF